MKKLLILLLSAVLIFSSVFRSEQRISADTMTPVCGYTLMNGVSNVTIYIDIPSGASFWQTYITSSANNWMYTGWDNPIYIQFVSSNYGSTFDFYAYPNTYWTNQGHYGIAAQTIHRSPYATVVSPKHNNWLYADIYINDDIFRSDLFTSTMAHTTVRHEMGHAFGLDEYPSNPNSIMYNGSDYDQVSTVQQCDNDAILYLYGD